MSENSDFGLKLVFLILLEVHSFVSTKLFSKKPITFYFSSTEELLILLKILFITLSLMSLKSTLFSFIISMNFILNSSKLFISNNKCSFWLSTIKASHETLNFGLSIGLSFKEVEIIWTRDSKSSKVTSFDPSLERTSKKWLI